MHRTLVNKPAAGTALSASSTETVLQTGTLKAGTLLAGKRLRISAKVRATATNAADTLTVRVRMGSVTLTGTALCTTAATDAANDDVIGVDVDLVVRSVAYHGTAATVSVVASGSLSGIAAEAVGTLRTVHEIKTDYDGAVDLFVEVTGQWSSANAGNSCQSEHFTIEELV